VARSRIVVTVDERGADDGRHDRVRRRLPDPRAGVPRHHRGRRHRGVPDEPSEV